jgi:antitoxin component of RelBE/YafQ-DinJ toxin-antitoxin module
MHKRATLERMTVLFRCRVEKPLLKKVNSVTQRLGTDTGEVFRIFLAEIARTGRIPVRLALEPAEAAVSPWEQRAETLESFYDESKAW